jgi:hypothetical protein
MTRTRLEYNVRKEVNYQVRKIFNENNAAHFPYNDSSTLEEIGMTDVDAAEFLNRLEDIYKFDFNELTQKLYEEAEKRTRQEEDSGFFAPEVPSQEMFVKVGDIVDYIVIGIKAKALDEGRAA